MTDLIIDPLIKTWGDVLSISAGTNRVAHHRVVYAQMYQEAGVLLWGRVHILQSTLSVVHWVYRVYFLERSSHKLYFSSSPERLHNKELVTYAV